MKNNKQTAKQALGITVKDQIINLTTDFWFDVIVYLAITLPIFFPIAWLAVSQGKIIGGIQIILLPYGAAIPLSFFWYYWGCLPIQKTEWWKTANKKVNAYKTIMAYAESCPLDDDVALVAHLDGALQGLVGAVKLCQANSNHKMAGYFRAEQKKLHAAIAGSHFANYYQAMPDWQSYYSRDKHLLN